MSILIPVIFGLLGIGLIILAIVQRYKAKAAEAWPTVPGVILSSGLSRHDSYDADTGTSTSFKPEVQYQYSVMGQNFVGDQISFGNVSYSYNIAAKKIAPYPQGTQVLVHYNPSDPSKAVLETKSAGGVVLIIVGAVFIVIAIVTAIGSTG
jgi:hypothetical protein